MLLTRILDVLLSNGTCNTMYFQKAVPVNNFCICMYQHWHSNAVMQHAFFSNSKHDVMTASRQYATKLRFSPNTMPTFLLVSYAPCLHERKHTSAQVCASCRRCLQVAGKGSNLLEASSDSRKNYEFQATAKVEYRKAQNGTSSCL